MELLAHLECHVASPGSSITLLLRPSVSALGPPRFTQRTSLLPVLAPRFDGASIEGVALPLDPENGQCRTSGELWGLRPLLTSNEPLTTAIPPGLVPGQACTLGTLVNTTSEPWGIHMGGRRSVFGRKLTEADPHRGGRPATAGTQLSAPNF
jgi:hypothetical protein